MLTMSEMRTRRIKHIGNNSSPNSGHLSPNITKGPQAKNPAWEKVNAIKIQTNSPRDLSCLSVVQAGMLIQDLYRVSCPITQACRKTAKLVYNFAAIPRILLAQREFQGCKIPFRDTDNVGKLPARLEGRVKWGLSWESLHSCKQR